MFQVKRARRAVNWTPTAANKKGKEHAVTAVIL
jgi:hypothetical protein